MTVNISDSLPQAIANITNSQQTLIVITNSTGNDTGGTTEFLADDCNLKGLMKFAADFQAPHGVISLCVALAGILFNVLNIAVLTNPKMRNPVNLLLTFLAICELSLLVIYVPFIILYNLEFPARTPRYHSSNEHITRYLLFYVDASVFFHLAACWMIITTACFRFIFVQFPLRSAKWCSYRRATVAGCLTIAASLLISLPNMVRNTVTPRIFEKANPCYDIVPMKTYFTISASKGFSHPVHGEHLESFNYWLFAIVGKIIPTVLLLVFTIFLVLVLLEANKRRERLHSDATVKKREGTSGKENEHTATTRMLLAVVFMFFLVEVPHGVLVIYSSSTGDFNVYEAMGELIDLLTLIAFSVNFILYSMMSRMYRNLFRELIMRPLKAKGQFTKLRMRYTSGTSKYSDSISNRKNLLDAESCVISTMPSESQTMISKVHSSDD